MSVAFDIVFALFVLAMAAVALLAVRWAVLRDRAERTRRESRSNSDGQANPEAVR